MTANTSPKLELLLVLEQSWTWSNARYSRQHKCRPMLKLTKWISAAIPCGPYLLHGAFVEFFSPCLGWLKGGTSCLCLSCLASFWNRSERIWWQRYYGSWTLGTQGTLFGVCFVSLAHKLPYVSEGVLPLKTLILYINQPRGTMNRQATIQPIIFFLHGVREGYDPMT
jgi:hypothetical protein